MFAGLTCLTPPGSAPPVRIFWYVSRPAVRAFQTDLRPPLAPHAIDDGGNIYMQDFRRQDQHPGQESSQRVPRTVNLQNCGSQPSSHPGKHELPSLVETVFFTLSSPNPVGIVPVALCH